MKLDAIVIDKAPGDKWKTPLNFETHEKHSSPGMGQRGGEVEAEMYKELKAAVEVMFVSLSVISNEAL